MRSKCYGNTAVFRFFEKRRSPRAEAKSFYRNVRNALQKNVHLFNHHAMIRWLFMSATLLGLAATLAMRGKGADFGGFEPALITVNIAVAVLAINFSFAAYQSSEYRLFQRGLSSNLLFFCLCVLVGALSPVIALVFYRSLVGVVGITALPVTAFLSVGLVAIAKYEATPNALIKSLISKRKWHRAFRAYSCSVEANKIKWKQHEFAKLGDMPTHEYSWAPLPPVHQNDPFGMLGAIGRTAAKAGDAVSLVRVTQALLDALDTCYAEHYSKRKKKRFSTAAADTLKAQLRRLSIAAEEADSTGDISGRFLDACAEYLGTKAGDERPLVDTCFFVMVVMLESGERWLAKGNAEIAKTPLIIIRLFCQKGVDQWEKQNEKNYAAYIDSVFCPHNVARLALIMKRLGSSAIEVKETDYLYRVFDAFGWLGCSALKAGNRETVAACVRSLTQLGREARVKGLECHWDRCAVKPEDHARERIEWILSWVVKQRKESQSCWLGLCSQGLSRLAGQTVKITMAERDGNIGLEREVISEAYKESFGSAAGFRELDYSDFSMLKDFELHGSIGGTIIHGPPTPIFPDEEDQ